MNSKASSNEKRADTSHQGSNRSTTLEDGTRSHTSTAQFTPPESGGEDTSSRESVSQSTEDPASSFGQIKITGTETSYVGSAHWASILDSISDLKNELDDNDAEIESNEWQNESNLSSSNANSLLRSPMRLTKPELLHALPPKHIVDKVLATWFNSSDPFITLIHKIQFENEYRQFWKEPSKAPVMWLGLLYAIMSLGCFFRLHSTKSLDSPTAFSICAEADRYHDLSAAAAILADYTIPQAFTIECLLLQGGSWRMKAAALDVWLLLGVTVRIALRLGYHRDASHYGDLSPYSQEMRRRIFAGLYMADTMTSFQLGLPAMLRTVQSDTKVRKLNVQTPQADLYVTLTRSKLSRTVFEIGLPDRHINQALV